MDKKSKAFLTELSRGVQLTFSNAEQLYNEGSLLRKKGSLSRALFLHQISLEECGKIDIIGSWAIHLLVGGKVDIAAMTKAFRSHEAKNYANAYFAKVTPEEEEARKRGDLKAAVDAFRQFQEKFHEESNSAKNASLYIDFRENIFSSPSDMITMEMVKGVATVNVYFLGLTAPKVRMLERIEKDEGALQATMKWFTERVEKLKEDDPKMIGAAMEALIEEMLERHTKRPAGGGSAVP